MKKETLIGELSKLLNDAPEDITLIDVFKTAIDEGAFGEKGDGTPFKEIEIVATQTPEEEYSVELIKPEEINFEELFNNFENLSDLPPIILKVKLILGEYVNYNVLTNYMVTQDENENYEVMFMAGLMNATVTADGTWTIETFG